MFHLLSNAASWLGGIRAADAGNPQQSSKSEDPGLCRLKELRQDDPYRYWDRTNSARYQQDMDELIRQWPLTDERHRSELLTRGEQIRSRAFEKEAPPKTEPKLAPNESPYDQKFNELTQRRRAGDTLTLDELNFIDPQHLSAPWVIPDVEVYDSE